MLKIKKFFIERRAGFYVSAAAVLAVIAGAFVYLAVYNGTPYMSWMVFVLPFISAAAFAVLCSFGKTETTAPVLCAVLNFISFLIYTCGISLPFGSVLRRNNGGSFFAHGPGVCKYGYALFLFRRSG